MRRVFAFVLLLLVAATQAQAPDPASEDPATCPGLALIVHHPYPDSADPLGINWQGSGQDAYYGRYQHLDADSDGFDFPHVVFDGVTAIEGIPDSSAPYVSTRDAYEAAFAARSLEESPVGLTITSARDGDQAKAVVQAVVLGAPLDPGVRLFAALLEDPVHYAPPPAVSNGVTVHPFVLRDLQVVDFEPGSSRGFVFDAPPGDGSHWVAAWLQQPAVDGRFDAHEVIQAGLTEVGGAAYEACGNQRAVLMEMYSATWCDTCLFGDRVAEEMAEREGILGPRTEAREGYLVNPPWAWMGWLAAAAVGLAVALVRLPGERS